MTLTSASNTNRFNLYKSYPSTDKKRYSTKLTIEKNIVSYSPEVFDRKLPTAFPFLVNLLNRSKKILDLKENWDDNGSEIILESTLASACSFLLEYAEAINKKYGYTIDEPKIYPNAYGSIDIYWDMDSYEFLVNIEKGGISATYYADNKQIQKTEGVFNPHGFDINLLPKAISFLK
jgi:hypothetical protein